jgi:hypothetical protein
MPPAFGRLTAARRAMLPAAIVSAGPENPQPIQALRRGRFRRGQLAGNQQVPAPVDQAQVRFAVLAGQALLIHRPAGKSDALAPAQGEQAHRAVGQVPGKHARIVREAAQLAEARPAESISRIGIGHLGDGAHRHLGREPEAHAGGSVHQPVHGEPPEDLLLGGLAGDPGAGPVAPGEGGAQQVSLFCRGQELDLSDEYHSPEYRTPVRTTSTTRWATTGQLPLASRIAGPGRTCLSGRGLNILCGL